MTTTTTMLMMITNTFVWRSSCYCHYLCLSFSHRRRRPNKIGQYSNNCCNRDNQIEQEKYGERVGGIKYIGGDGTGGFFPISNIEGYPNFDIFLCLPIISPPSSSSSLPSSSSSGSLFPAMIIGFYIFGLS